MIEEQIVIRRPQKLFHEFLEYQMRKRKWPFFPRKKFLKKMYVVVLKPEYDVPIVKPYAHSPKRTFRLTDVWGHDYGYREMFYILSDFSEKVLFYDYFLNQLIKYGLKDEERYTAKLFLMLWEFGKKPKQLDVNVLKAGERLVRKYDPNNKYTKSRVLSIAPFPRDEKEALQHFPNGTR